MRLIDADILEDYVIRQMTFYDNADMYCMLDAIEKQPIVTADSIVKHGYWVKRARWKNHVCSECSFESNTAYNFCPNCGVKMGE